MEESLCLKELHYDVLDEGGDAAVKVDEADAVASASDRAHWISEMIR